MDPDDYSVTFQLRSGDQRQYFYIASDFAEIAAGADPRGYAGSQTPLQQNHTGIDSDIVSAGEEGEATVLVDEILDAIPDIIIGGAALL
jgi:hypothetical protein